MVNELAIQQFLYVKLIRLSLIWNVPWIIREHMLEVLTRRMSICPRDFMQYSMHVKKTTQNRVQHLVC